MKHIDFTLDELYIRHEKSSIKPFYINKYIMAQITDKTRDEVKEVVLDFFAEECEMEINEISENSSIIGDLDGDSLMFLELS